jgi:hypothetical protein
MDDFVINIHVDKKTCPIMAKPALKWDGNGKAKKSIRKKKKKRYKGQEMDPASHFRRSPADYRVGKHSKGYIVVG